MAKNEKKAQPNEGAEINLVPVHLLHIESGESLTIQLEKAQYGAIGIHAFILCINNIMETTEGNWADLACFDGSLFFDDLYFFFFCFAF